MPLESDYLRVGRDVFTDSKSRRWRLDFDETTDPPTPIFAPVLTWADMKLKFATWGDVNAAGLSWGIAKGL